MKFDIENKTLASFLEAAASTTTELIAGSTPAFLLVQEVDEFIRKKVWAHDVRLDPIPAMLALNSFYSFLGAVRVALAGQLVTTFPLVRQSLESACYAYVMTHDPRLVDIWVSRNRGAKQMQACRKGFTGAVKRASRGIDAKQEQLGELIRDLYEATIDFGAHPNPRSIVPHVRMTEMEEGVCVSVPCLFRASDIRTQQSLVACAETGIAIAFVTALAAEGHPLVRDGFEALETMYRRVRETMDALGE